MSGILMSQEVATVMSGDEDMGAVGRVANVVAVIIAVAAAVIALCLAIASVIGLWVIVTVAKDVVLK